MTNISPSLYDQVRSTLLRCGPFDSNHNLKVSFVDARISEWRDLLPDAAPSRLVRAETVINALSERFNAAGDNALVLLLRVLRDRTSPGDACYHQLETLADALVQALKPPTVTVPKPDISSGSSFRERKRQLVQQRLDALIEEYEAASRQLMQLLDETQRLRIQRRMESLERQIEETEAEL